MKDYLAGDAQWRWPHLGDAAPQGVKLNLLTVGGVSVVGHWAKDAGFIAWAPLIRITDKQAFQTALKYFSAVRRHGPAFEQAYRLLVEQGTDPAQAIDIVVDNTKPQCHTAAS